MSYIFDEKYLKQDILFIAWDYDHARFVMLPPPEGDGIQGFLFAKKMKPFRL